MTGTRKRLDPDSFRGKISLLVVDKLILGAVVALALVTYDGYRRADDRSYQERVTKEARDHQDVASRVQLDFERARLAREFLPSIFDEATDVTVRGYLLRSGVVTGSIDVESAITIASQLQRKGLTEQDFFTVTSPMLPNGTAAVARRASELLAQYSRVHAPDGSFNVSDYSTVAKDMERLEQEKRLWRVALWRSWTSDPRNAAFDALESPAFLAQNLEGLYFLLGEDSYTDSLDLSLTAPRGLRLIGYLHRLKSAGSDKEALTYVSKDLQRDLADLDGIALARAILRVLVKQFPRAYGPAAEPIARVVVAERPKAVGSGGIESYKIRSEFFSLQWEAVEALHTIAKNGPRIVRRDSVKAAEPILLQCLAQLRHRLEQIRSDDEKNLESLAGEFESGKLVRMMIAILEDDRSPNATRELEALLGTGTERLRVFPFLEEDLKRTLRGPDAAANPGLNRTETALSHGPAG